MSDRNQTIPANGKEHPTLGHAFADATRERVCNRNMNGVFGDGEVCCNEPAVAHVMWNTDLENGFACAEHLDWIKQNYTPYAIHPLGGGCGMPASKFFEAENTCRVDGDDLEVAEPTRTIREPEPVYAVANPTNTKEPDNHV